MNNTLGTIESMFALRAWCRDNLPTDNSLIAYDLILLMALAGEKNQQLTIKQLFSSLPHSYTAVRQHYNRFIREGWLSHQSDEKDGRIKYIQPTDKFRQTVKNYSNAANHIFLNKPQ